MTGTETTANDVNLEKEFEKPKGRPKQKQLYTFKLLKGTNFPRKDFMIHEPIEKKVMREDKDGKEFEDIVLEPGERREPVDGEYGEHTKLWPNTFVAVKGEVAEHFVKHLIGEEIRTYA